jgi:hypothetical protein
MSVVSATVIKTRQTKANSSYGEIQKKNYAKYREHNLKRMATYYQQNKDEIRQKRMARYYTKKALATVPLSL